MSPLDLLQPETTPEEVPFSVRLAERWNRRSPQLQSRSERRAHLRRSARDLEWLRMVRLTGGIGYSVNLIDLSEGGALLEVDAPLRPGIILTLEISGAGLEAVVPLEVLRCYVASLRGNAAVYRGACAFRQQIELPGERAGRTPESAPFVGTDAALTYLLDRCSTDRESATGPRVTLERTDVLRILDSLHGRKPADSSDPLNRYAAELLGAILPVLHDTASRDDALAALEERLGGFPERWQVRLQPTRWRLVSLIDHCLAPATDDTSAATGIVAPAPVGPRVVVGDTAEPVLHGASAKVDSAFQKIVARFADGQIVKGYTQDFHPSRPQFSLWPTIHAAPGDRLVVPVTRLKAVFFVRDFKGNSAYRERKTFTTRGQGRRVEVTFNDGEIVLGTTLNYRPDGQGFFISPADQGANNTRIFVVASAARRVRFL
jgi:hypothetical protein